MPTQTSTHTRWANLLYKLGILLMVLPLIVHFFYPNYSEVGYALVGGSLLYTLSHTLMVRSERDIRGRRLRSIAVLSGVIFISGGYLFIVQQSYWRLLLSIASLLVLYSNIVLLYHQPRDK